MNSKIRYHMSDMALLMLTIVVVIVSCLVVISVGVFSGIEVTCYVMVPENTACLRTVWDFIF